MTRILNPDRFLTELFDCNENGWLAPLCRIGHATNWPISILLGIASRESNMRHIIGDHGNGYGLMQVDVRSDPKVKDYWQDKETYINNAVAILASKRIWLITNAGKSVTLWDSQKRKATFVVPTFPEPLLTRTAIAMYNTGAWAAYHYTKGRDVDYSTTGKNYSGDVLARAGIFESLLAQAQKIVDAITLEPEEE